MTVRKNIAYPLRARHERRGLQDGWVDDIAAAVDCGELLARYPSQLSGGSSSGWRWPGAVARPR